MKAVAYFGTLLCLLLMIVMLSPLNAEPQQPDPLERLEVIESEPEATLKVHRTLDDPSSAEVAEVIEPKTVPTRYRFGQEQSSSGDEVLNRAGNSSGLSLGKIAISLAFVILMVLILGWTFKKLTLRVPGSQHMKVISSIPLGQRERLLVIEIQGKQRVLGVTPQQINYLFELEESLPEEKLASEFHSQLQSWLKK